MYDMKKVGLFVAILLLLIGGLYVLSQDKSDTTAKPQETTQPVKQEEVVKEDPNANKGPEEAVDEPVYDIEAEFAEVARLVDKGKLQEAADKADQILAVNRADTNVRIRVADFFFETLDDVNKAMTIIDEGLDLDRTNTDLMVAMAHFFTYQSDAKLYPIGLEMVKTAIKLKEEAGEPIPIKYMDILAWATSLQEKQKEALDIYFNKIFSKPEYTQYDDPVTMLHFGFVNEAMGDLDRAEKVYRDILALTDETLNADGKRHSGWAKMQAGIALNRTLELKKQ